MGRGWPGLVLLCWGQGGSAGGDSELTWSFLGESGVLRASAWLGDGGGGGGGGRTSRMGGCGVRVGAGRDGRSSGKGCNWVGPCSCP